MVTPTVTPTEDRGEAAWSKYVQGAVFKDGQDGVGRQVRVRVSASLPPGSASPSLETLLLSSSPKPSFLPSDDNAPNLCPHQPTNIHLPRLACVYTLYQTLKHGLSKRMVCVQNYRQASAFINQIFLISRIESLSRVTVHSAGRGRGATAPGLPLLLA